MLLNSVFDHIVDHWKHDCQFDAVEFSVSNDDILGRSLDLFEGLKGLLLQHAWEKIVLHGLDSLVKLFDEFEVLEHSLHADCTVKLAALNCGCTRRSQCLGFRSVQHFILDYNKLN